jgi:hypothetical protein
MTKRIVRICSKCKTQMRLIACPDGTTKWQCQNPKCSKSKIRGIYPKK